MGSATKLLDVYRKSVTDDPLGFWILSLLLRSDELSEDEIAETTEVSQTEVRLKLLELYRASYARLSSSTSWSLTELGETILDRLELTPFASASLIPSFKPEVGSSDFLKLYVHWISAVQPHKSLSTLRSLRNFHSVNGFLDTVNAPRRSVTQRALTSILFGFDSNFRAVPHELTCKAVTDWAVLHSPDPSITQEVAAFTTRHTCHDWLATASRDAKRSNVFLASENLGREEKVDTLNNVLLLLRVTDSLRSSQPDPDLTAIARTSENFSEKLTSQLRKSYPKSTDLFHFWTRSSSTEHDARDNDAGWKVVTEQLDSVLYRELRTGLERISFSQSALAEPPRVVDSAGVTSGDPYPVTLAIEAKVNPDDVKWQAVHSLGLNRHEDSPTNADSKSQPSITLNDLERHLTSLTEAQLSNAEKTQMLSILERCVAILNASLNEGATP